MKRLESVISHLLHGTDRLLSTLLMAASVTLLAAGFLWFGSPGATSPDLAYAGATGAATATALPLADPGSFPSTPPAVTTTVTPAPTDSGVPAGSALPSPQSASPSAPLPSPSPGDPAVATRIVVPSLEIDLPVVSRDLSVPNQGPNEYPPCDVAVYHTSFVQPGEDGTTYIYGHAREGMFLPLLTASEQQDGASLIGSLVEVYTDDDLRYVYAITEVQRHSTDYSLALNVAPGVRQLVLQTSEGPRGTVPKLQILAVFQDVLPASDADSHPKPHPRACYDTP